MADSRKKGPSQRQLKVGEEIRHALSEIFMREDFYDRASGEQISITISEVRVSPDLRNATVFAMPLAGKEKERTMERLNKDAPYIRKLLASKVQMRFLPAVLFRLDRSFDEASKLDMLFNSPKVRADITKTDS